LEKMVIQLYSLVFQELVRLRFLLTLKEPLRMDLPKLETREKEG
jgi:hypothetical protein